MRHLKPGNWIVAALVAVNLIFWLAFPPQNDGREAFLTQYLGEMFSTSALIVMSCGILLSLRPRWVEPLFGGLDKMYVAHKQLALAAAGLLGGHFIVVSIGRGLQPGASLGKIALVGLSLSILMALAPRIPFWGGNLRLGYQQWKLIHRFTGAFFLVGILHSFRVDTLLQTSLVTNLYVRAISFTGAALYIYKELLDSFLRKGYAYIVERVNRLNGAVVEVTLKPRQAALQHRAGQFLFIRFPGQKGLDEAHPFTISSAPEPGGQVRLSIKASGDFTQRLHAGLEPGSPARLEGAYGEFDYTRGSRKQIWVAGGIGLTPFLSWVRALPAEIGREIHFFYTVRSVEEALFVDELEAAARRPGFHLYQHYSNRDGRLSAEAIAGRAGPLQDSDIYLCGPLPMTEALTAGFRALGASPDRLHYEEFNFR